MRTLFKDAYLISPDVELEGASVLVEDGIIRHVYACGDKLPEQVDRTVMVQGDMLVPGFADIHTHGRHNSSSEYLHPERRGACRRLALRRRLC